MADGNKKIVGNHTTTSEVTADELHLLRAYRQADERGKDAIMRMADFQKEWRGTLRVVKG